MLRCSNVYKQNVNAVCSNVFLIDRSPELTYFWAEVEQREIKMVPLNNLCDIMLTVEPDDIYQSKMAKVLSIPGSAPIPFYGYLIAEIKVILEEDGDSEKVGALLKQNIYKPCSIKEHDI